MKVRTKVVEADYLIRNTIMALMAFNTVIKSSTVKNRETDSGKYDASTIAADLNRPQPVEGPGPKEKLISLFDCARGRDHPHESIWSIEVSISGKGFEEVTPGTLFKQSLQRLDHEEEDASMNDMGLLLILTIYQMMVDVSTNRLLIKNHNLRKVTEALEDESWVEAMQEELLQFKLQQVWVLVDLPNGAKIEAIRLFLAFASFMGFIVYQMDVKSAFLYDTIDEEVYVSQPPGFVDPDHPTKKISFYGSPTSLGVMSLKLKMQTDSNEFKGNLNIFSSLSITPWRPSTFDKRIRKLLNGDVHRTDQCIEDLQVSQGKPTCGCMYPRESPFDLEAFSIVTMGFPYLDRKSTTVVVNFLVKKTYLMAKSAITTSNTDGSLEISATIDTIRKSTTGGCQFLGQRLISWQCKKQTIVATSTTEAEYVAAANCCGQVLWVQNQLLDYGFNFMNTKIHIDNESTICIVKNPVYHSKTKHIEIRHHFIRDCYEKKLISVEKIHTDLNVADLLTKPFDGPRFNYLVVSIGFAEIVDFLRGSNLRYALTANPTIYDSLVKQFWQSAVASTREDGSLEISATVDTKRYIISEASIRDSLQLDDATGISMLPNDDLFEGMGQIGYPTDGTFTFWKSFFTPQWRYLVHHLLHCLSSKSGGWDQFGSNIATALICLSTGRVYNFSKLIFDGMMANLKNKKKFLMYPRFLQIILNIQTENKHPYLAVSLTKKIFGNMKRGFQGAPRPLLPSMLLVATNLIAGQEHAAQAQTQPIPPPPPIPSTTPTPIPTSTSPPQTIPSPTPPPIPTPTSPPPPPPETEPSTLQTKTPKRLKEEKGDEAKDDESTKKSGKRRKQMARKGMNTSVDEDDSEDSDKVDEQEETNTGTETPINPVPVAMKTPSVATYKIIKQGEKGVYQIVREDGTDIVYINFGAMLKSISRDDLTELYRIVMNRYGLDGPEDKLEKGFWKCLRIMFEEPLSTDSIWSEIGQQKIVSWRYYDTSRVHCLNLESMDVYLLSDRKYPLSAEVCKTMLKMKLLDGKMSEDCYRLLKMMEKQAGIRK
ncbi:putative ribonuclease H-like domain-containing protein [Tanacetum coccineum]